MDSSFSPKDKIWFLRVCHHISNSVYYPNTGLEGQGSHTNLGQDSWCLVRIHPDPDFCFRSLHSLSGQLVWYLWWTLLSYQSSFWQLVTLTILHCKVNNGPSIIQHYHYAEVVLKWDGVWLNDEKVQAGKDVRGGFQGCVIAFTGKEWGKATKVCLE